MLGGELGAGNATLEVPELQSIVFVYLGVFRTSVIHFMV